MWIYTGHLMSRIFVEFIFPNLVLIICEIFIHSINKG